MLAAALAVELVDEMVDGTKSAALPLIRQNLSLSYGQIGLLASVPLLLGGLLELPLGVLAGHGRRRRRAVLAALRRPAVARCLVLLQVCDLLLDILTGFVALYLVDVVHASPEQAALGVAIRLGAGLAGDAALVWALRRAGGLSLLRASAAAAAALYPGFLLVPGIGLKLLLLGGLSFATAPWYPMLQAQLYGSLPDSSGIAVSLSSAAGLLGGAGPLAVGFLAQRFGLTWALAGLAAAPLCVLGGLWRWPPGGGAPEAGGP